MKVPKLKDLIKCVEAYSLWESIQPDIYVERTSLTFKTSPEKVKKYGALSTNWETKDVFRIEMGLCGLYGVDNLRTSPHYQVYRNRKGMASAAKARGANLWISRADSGVANVFEDGDVFSVCNNDETYAEVTHKYAVEMDFPSILEELDGIDVCDRNNIAITRGIADQNIKCQGTGDEKTLPKPMPFAENEKIHVERMCIMTKAVYDLCDALKMSYPAIVEDTERLDEFALAMCRKYGIEPYDESGRPANIFEMATFAMTDCPQKRMTPEELSRILLFGCHVDSKNCPIHQKVFVMYYHIFHNGRWVRVVAIMTWRKAALDYMRRKDGAEFLTEQVILPYFDNYAERHKRTLDDAHREEYKNRLYEPYDLLCSFHKLAGKRRCWICLLIFPFCCCLALVVVHHALLLCFGSTQVGLLVLQVWSGGLLISILLLLAV